MSLRIQVEKKKAQDEMRRLMAERKHKDKKPNQLNNPLAKYNNLGQLTCVLCSSIVRSEQVWKVHVNSKQHRENVDKAKKLKELTNNFTDVKVKKRLGATITDAPEEKKIKGILKNSMKSVPIGHQKPKNDAPNVYSYHNEEIKRKEIISHLSKAGDNPEKPTVLEDDEPEDLKTESEKTNAPPIPEGFFDDPILDAKVIPSKGGINSLKLAYLYEKGNECRGGQARLQGV